MALPGLFPLFGDELRNWLRTSGEQFFTRHTGAEGLALAREFGMQIRTSDFYDIRREVLGLQLHQEQLAGLTENTLIPQAWTVFDHGLTLSENFQYRFNVTGTTISTGEAFDRRYAVSSMYQLTPQQAGDLLTGMLMNAEEESAMTIDSMELSASLGNPGML